MQFKPIFRAKIEADYAKKLKTWNEKMIKALEASTMYGSHQKGLIAITAQSEKIANHHQQIHDKIHSDCSTRVRLFLSPYRMTREVPYFRHFVWVRQPANSGYGISIGYFSELVNHVSKKLGSPNTTKIYQ